MILAVFKKCYVCGEDVLAGEGEDMACCASHSRVDRLNALNKIRAKLQWEKDKVLNEIRRMR